MGIIIIRRTIQEVISQSLFQWKAIIIYGARQVGKTTLIRAIQQSSTVQASRYVTLRRWSGWCSHQKQEIDYLEELNGELRGYEIKWREKRLKVPAGFRAAYPDCPVSLINQENMTGFVTG